MSDTPQQMKLKGGMTSSKVAGNGFYFEKKGLIGLVSDSVQAPYVIDHGMDLSAIAGQVNRVFVVEEGTVDLPIINGPKKGQTKPWDYVIIGHESKLSSDFPAYPAASQYILATARSGKVPQESISMQVSSLAYDEETDQLILKAPFSLVHHSAVSKGAFGPEDGVGIGLIEFSATGDSSVSLPSATAPAAPVIANIADLAIQFSAKYAGNQAAFAAAARAGIVTLAPPTTTSTATNTMVISTSPASISGTMVGTFEAPEAKSGDLNTVRGLLRTGDQFMAPDNTPAGASPAAPAPATEALVALQREVEGLKASLAAQTNAALSQERERLMADCGMTKEQVSACPDLASLRALESVHRQFAAKRTAAAPAGTPAVDEAAAEIKEFNVALAATKARITEYGYKEA